jgi:large subunit ribosomal protein L1
MGKIRTRIIGNEEIEEKQKEEQKKRSAEKKMEKNKEKAKPEKEAPSEPAKKKDSEEVKATPVQGGKEKPEGGEKKKKNKKGSARVARVRGKKYTGALKKLDQTKKYTVEDAINELKKIAYAKFEESVELHINVLKESLRGEVDLPHTTGKTLRVTIVSDAVLEQLEKGVIDFDILISHPSFMPKLAKYARTLGPKGLMPNPKSGTISPNPEEAAKKFQGGTLRWKTEGKAPLIHQMVAKLPHDVKTINENVTAFLHSVGVGNIKKAFVKSTMSPSLELDLEKI